MMQKYLKRVSIRVILIIEVVPPRHASKGIKIMKAVNIKLSLAENVKYFVNIANKYPYDLDLRVGRHVVDGKSILGIFSLDLSRPITLEVYSDHCEDLMEELKQVAMEAIDRCQRKRVRDWSAIKSAIKNDISGYLFKTTKRNPMVIPVVTKL